jgi:cell division septal protein FtsQ
MAKRKNNNVSTKKKTRWFAFVDWMPTAFVQSFAWIMLVLFLVGAGLGVREVVYADPLLRLKVIQVFPPDSLPVSKLESLQKKWLGKNTSQIDLLAISRDLELDHRVLSADVRRKLPDHLEVHVERRRPFAYVHFGRKGRWAMISRDAVVIDVVPKPASGLYVVESDELANQIPKFGMRLSKNMLGLVRMTDAFSKHPVSQTEKITAIAMLPNDSAVLVLGELFIKVNLNDANPEQTFSKYQYLLETETRAMIEYVDLRFNRVILKRKAETKPALVQKRQKR